MQQQFETFNDVQDIALRTYNRAVTATNIVEGFNEGKARDYLNQFTEAEQKGIMAILVGINKFGADKVKQAIMIRVAQGD
ncbi:MAG: hypothetical protein ACRCVU_13945 [Flavobacterium sp.]